MFSLCGSKVKQNELHSQTDQGFCCPISGIHVCWSEHSDSSFVYGFMRLIYGLGTMTTTT